MRIAQGAQSQESRFFVSKDGKKILQGTVYDIANNPFKTDLDKLKNAVPAELSERPARRSRSCVFSDFQCPYCKEEAKMLRQNLIPAYPTQVRLYFKTFPLETLHPWAKAAAIASRCVFQQKPDAFWEYHDWIFAHQADITPENLKDKVLEWAKDNKDLDALQLGACIDSKATEAEVDKEIEEGTGARHRRHAHPVRQRPPHSPDHRLAEPRRRSSTTKSNIRRRPRMPATIAAAK